MSFKIKIIHAKGKRDGATTHIN